MICVTATDLPGYEKWLQKEDSRVSREWAEHGDDGHSQAALDLVDRQLRRLEEAGLRYGVAQSMQDMHNV